MGERLDGIALAALRLGSLSGSVWEDIDFDGLRGEGEPGLPRVPVTLWRFGEPEPLAGTETGRDGSYRFDALPPGEYTLRFALPQGYLFALPSEHVPAEAGDRETEITVKLAMGEAIGGLDAGTLRPAALGGLVWSDSNNDGMLDANEPPIPGVALELFREGDPERTVAAAVSDGEGYWRMENLVPDTYRLRAALPDGYLFALAPKWSNANRAGNLYGTDGPAAVSGPIALEAGQRALRFHFGGVPAAHIAGGTWLDADDDGLRSPGDPALGGVRVSLLAGDAVIAAVDTGERGDYRFDGLRPGAYALRFELPHGYLFARAPQEEGAKAGLVHGLDGAVGESASFALAMGEWLTGRDTGALPGAAVQGAIWLDRDEDGVRGDGEEGCAGALVEILAADSDEALAGVRTQADGAFRFENLRPGSYRVRVDLPDGDLFAPQAGDVLKPLDDRQGLTAPFALEMGGEADLGPIAALHGASVGGAVWEDANVNGLFDHGEEPLADVGVVLLRRKGDAWETAGATQTDEQGEYRFDVLPPGTYAARFTLPAGYLFTDLPAAGAQGARSAVEPVAGQTGQTEPFRLDMGEKRGDLHAGGIRPGTVGDYAWVDLNGNGLQDYGEPPLPGVTVTLFVVGADGRATELSAARTDEYGLYRFEGLRPGVYRLRAELPAGYSFTVNRTGLQEIDSDIAEGPGPAGETADFSLRSGQTRRDIDIGARRSE